MVLKIFIISGQNRRWGRQGGAIALLAVLLFAACGDNRVLQQQIQVEKIYFHAEKAAGTIRINPLIAPKQDFDDAIALYRQVVKVADSSVTTPITVNLLKLSLMKIAELELMQQKLDNAVGVYEEVLKRFQNENEEVCMAARLYLGLLHERSFQFHDAINDYAGLLPNFVSAVDPANPQAYLFAIPLQYARLNKLSRYDEQSREAYNRAAELYRQIIAKWPNTKAEVVATNYLAALMADQQQWSELYALVNQKLASVRDTTYLPEYLFWKGLLLHNRSGKLAEAMQVFQNFQDEYPAHRLTPQVRFEVAQITWKQGNAADAIELFKTIISEHRNVPEVAANARAQLAHIYETQGHWDAAVNEYRFLAKEFETTTPGLTAMFDIARYYTEHGETKLAGTAYQEAIVFYQEIIRKYPQSLVAAIAQEQITTCFATQRKWEEALSAASKISTILDNNVGRVSAYLLLGSIYESTGQPHLAVKAYQEIIKQFPQHPLVGALKEKVQKLANS